MKSNLFSKFPNLAAEWHSKNELSPLEVSAYSDQKVWWQCSQGHEWQTRISNRTSGGSKCHVCSGYSKQQKCQYSVDGSRKSCNGCGSLLLVTNFRIRTKDMHQFYSSICKTCEYDKKNYERTMTKQGLVAEIISRKKSDSRAKNLPFDLSKEWVLERLEQIQWCCELTGLPMKVLKSDAADKIPSFNWDSISVDRLNPKGGYTKDNIRFVLNQVNIFRQDGTDEQMYKIADALLKTRVAKNEV